MRTVILLFSLLPLALSAEGQTVLALDSCRAWALRGNKQLAVSRMRHRAATLTRKAVRTKYLPRVDAMGGYAYFNREVSILSDQQKTLFAGLGELMSQMGQQQLAAGATQVGEAINDAFHTDTKNVWTGSVMLRQPVYMGGIITAANRIASATERMAETATDLSRQQTLYDVDQAYWLVASLTEKAQLAESYRALVSKLSDDVHKMIRQGVATRADGLKVDVRVNEAEMQLTQATDGLSLAKMLLCQLCGLPMDMDIAVEPLADSEMVIPAATETVAADTACSRRPEIKMLEEAVGISRQTTKMVRGEYLPHVALTGGYLVSNPNVFDSFNRHFAGVWNVGVVVQVPVWNWFEGAYKVRASRVATSIAMMQLDDTREKISLQVTQSRYRLGEAVKKYEMARQSMASAEENLRCANVGFREGVMEVTDVMAAQTAWQQARSQKIDAEADVRLSEVNVKRALGEL